MGKYNNFTPGSQNISKNLFWDAEGCDLENFTLENNKILKNLYWNIHGQYSKLIGNKFNDQDFLDAIADQPHLIGIAELHTNETPSISGYHLIKQKIRKKMHKGPKISGGIAIFARNDVKSYFKHIPNKHDDLIWVKLKKEMSGKKNDIYICTSYISPSKGGEKDNDSLERVFDEVITFSNLKL